MKTFHLYILSTSTEPGTDQMFLACWVNEEGKLCPTDFPSSSSDGGLLHSSLISLPIPAPAQVNQKYKLKCLLGPVRCLDERRMVGCEEQETICPFKESGSCAPVGYWHARALAHGGWIIWLLKRI
jgi:hypothetical protein